MGNHRQLSRLLAAYWPNRINLLKLYRYLLAISISCVSLFPTAAYALYQYEYTGNPFTTTVNFIVPIDEPSYVSQDYITVAFTSPSLLTTNTSINEVSDFVISTFHTELNFANMLPYPNIYADPTSPPGTLAHPNYDAVFDIGAVDTNGIPTTWDISIDYNYHYGSPSRFAQSFMRTSTNQDITFGGFEGLSDSLGQINNNPGTWTISLISAVPEPETYAMLLAGLGLIGCTVRRRRSL